MDTRRRAMLDDIELADRQDRTAAAVRSRASDEQLLAESSILNGTVEGRAQRAEALRLSTLAKAPARPPSRDYSGVRLWTTADAGGQQN
jgi:hypothetical protein